MLVTTKMGKPFQAALAIVSANIIESFAIVWLTASNHCTKNNEHRLIRKSNRTLFFMVLTLTEGKQVDLVELRVVPVKDVIFVDVTLFLVSMVGVLAISLKLLDSN